MAFSSWFSRLRSSSKPIYSGLRYSMFHKHRNQSNVTEFLNRGKRHTSVLSWANSLVPMALMVSAGSLALQTQNNPSLCDSSGIGRGDVTFGGKGSTDYLVKGSHRDVPQELIDELRAICEDNMTVDYDERYFHGKPQNSFHRAVNIPDVVVFPRSQAVLKKLLCHLCKK